MLRELGAKDVMYKAVKLGKKCLMNFFTKQKLSGTLNVPLAGNPFLLSNIFQCLASFCACSLYEIGRGRMQWMGMSLRTTLSIQKDCDSRKYLLSLR